MNTEQYQQWKQHTYDALVSSGVYTPEQAEIIVKWFDSIKGQDERDMFGNNFINELSKHWKCLESKDFVYKTLSARAWLYADLILKEHNEEQKQWIS